MSQGKKNMYPIECNIFYKSSIYLCIFIKTNLLILKRQREEYGGAVREGEDLKQTPC